MEIKDLMPWRRQRKELMQAGDEDAFQSLQRGISNLFDDFARRMQLNGEWLPFGGGGFTPRVDVSEDEHAVTVVADIPGMDEKEIDVSLSGNLLTLKGEKKHESEKREGDYYRSERAFGAFRRVIQLPCEVDPERVEAKFKNGVLSVTLPKSAAAQEQRHKITIKAG